MRNGPVVILALSVVASSSCGDVNAALKKVAEARQLAANLLVQFTKASDAGNRAVMADTDEASVAFAREAEEAKQAVQKDIDSLGPILLGLGYSDETRLLNEFVSRYSEYRALDRRILDLAVENTNLKAQHFAFGPAQEAADAFRDALKTIAPLSPARDTWHVEALVATAVTTVREIQVLQAPHIANADEAVMTRMEKEMATSEAVARKALDGLQPLVAPASQPQLAVAIASLNRFIDLNAQIIALSRRNTNVRSLALSLDQKRTSTAACEESLRALQNGLAKRGYTGIRQQ
jgi:hypothetical protein